MQLVLSHGLSTASSEALAEPTWAAMALDLPQDLECLFKLVLILKTYESMSVMFALLSYWTVDPF